MSFVRKLIIVVIIILLPTLLYPQSTQKMDIYRFKDVNAPLPDTSFMTDIIKYIRDTLFLGGGVLSNIQYIGNPKGVGIFRLGNDIGFSNGLILSNGYVKTTTEVDGGYNKTGAQALPQYDSLGPYWKAGGAGLPPDGYLQDNDMDYMVGVIVGDLKADTAVDPSMITFKFKPYYKTIHLTYVFASEEYKWQYNPLNPPPPPVADVDLTGATASDFMAILVKKTSGEMSINNIASTRTILGDPPYIPISVKYFNHTFMFPGQYVPNYNPDKSYIFDGSNVPYDIRPFPMNAIPGEVVPCRPYWIKIAVADYPNGLVMGGYNLSHQINSAVFLKSYSLMSGNGLSWTVTSAIDNPDFVNDTAMVEGGCSNLNILFKFTTYPMDTMFLRMRIDNADLSDYTITPPLIQDSLIMIPDSVLEWPMTITAIDDGIPEGTGGVDKWYIRYQMDPCDVPTEDTGGWGTGTMGYSGLIKVKVYDYNPFNDTTKIYGPTLPPPSSQYHCGGDVTVTIADILTGGIPPYSYLWVNPPGGLGSGVNFTTPIDDSPDYAYCTITDRCSGKPGYLAGKDTVKILSHLDIQASQDFQLCQNGQNDIQVVSTNVGSDYTTVWHFLGPEPLTGFDSIVGYNSLYTVKYGTGMGWDGYGHYQPHTIVFECVVTDECGNVTSDTVHATFFPIVTIQGVPLVCKGYPITLTCSPAQTYQWYLNNFPGGTQIPGATSQTLTYTFYTPGNHTICVDILNECGNHADTCFTFFVDELILDMKLDGSSTDFSVCPNVPFTLEETSGDAEGGWEWTWSDNGPHTASGQSINFSLGVAGVHPVTVIAYNENGCYDTITRQVTVFPYSGVQAFTNLASVCIDYPAQLNATTGPVSIVNYYWTATPPDPSLAGKQNSASPMVFPQVTTVYQCKILDNNGCFDSTTVTVNVRQRLAVNIFANPDSSCTGDPVQLNFQTVVPPLPSAQYNWTFDDGVPATFNGSQPPQVIWNVDGLKTITLHIWEDGCDSTFTFHHMVNPLPLPAFSVADSRGCQPVTVTFSNTSSNLQIPTYLWDLGDGSTSKDVNPTHVYPNPGHYDVTLTVTNETGCINTFTLSDAVEVYEVPVAEFTADPQSATIDNPTINFTEEISIPFTIIDWNFGDSTGVVSGEPNPRHTYGAIGNYWVVMYTETEHGCWDRDTLEIGIVEDIEIFVPNAFSPNGDGLNDCFMVGGTTGDVVDIFRIIIYNRWGGLIFDSPISDPNCVWDGRDMNGVLVTPDTYVFRIYGKNFRGAKKVYEGMITIVK